jgi:hypothetical protein
MTKPPGGDQLANVLTKFTRPRTARLEWALVGFVIWLLSLDTCLVCSPAAEPISVDYAQHESARGTTERSQ